MSLSARYCGDTCDSCTASAISYQRCSACQLVQYCSRRCQKKDWPFHKKACGASQRPGTLCSGCGRLTSSLCGSCVSWYCRRCKHCSLRCPACVSGEKEEVLRPEDSREAFANLRFWSDEDPDVSFRIAPRKKKRSSNQKGNRSSSQSSSSSSSSSTSICPEETSALAEDFREPLDLGLRLSRQIPKFRRILADYCPFQQAALSRHTHLDQLTSGTASFVDAHLAWAIGRITLGETVVFESAVLYDPEPVR